MEDKELAGDCCQCGGWASDMHQCPYQQEINDDDEFECNCCASCTHECLMDI